jgi:hypothetical protein
MLAAKTGQETDHRADRAGLPSPGPSQAGAGLPTGFAVPVLETGSPGPSQAGAWLLHLAPGTR